MKTRTVLVILVPILVAALAAAQTKTGGKVPDVLHFTMNNINGQPAAGPGSRRWSGAGAR